MLPLCIYASLLAEKKTELNSKRRKACHLKKMPRVQLLTTVSNHQVSATWCTALLNTVFCIQSINRTINYTYIAKAFLCQAVLKYFIWMICFALYMIYIDCWSTHSPYSTQRFHLRETCCFICIVCWFFLVNFLLTYQRILSQSRKFSVSAFLRGSCVWNFESM